jgi:hypothetical protein
MEIFVSILKSVQETGQKSLFPNPKNYCLCYVKTCLRKFRCSSSNQDRRRTYNVTLRRFVQPLLQWKNSRYYIFWFCVCSLRYPACNAHAPYCHLWPVRLYNIFPHYLIKSAIFKKKIIEYKICAVWVSLQGLPETSLILRRAEWDMVKNLHWSLCKVPFFFLSRFIEHWNFLTNFHVIQISKFMKIRPVEAELFDADGKAEGRTEGQTERRTRRS